MDAILIGKILGAALTLMVFSYLLGNNPLYRIAQHLFIGVSIGYAVMLVLGSVLLPEVRNLASDPANASNWLTHGIPILLGIFLVVIRNVRPSARGGGFVLNVAVSTAAALALGGVLAGTMIPQLADTMRPLNNGGLFGILNSLIIIVGVAVTLFYFSFTLPAGGQRSATGAAVATAGRWLIVVTLGALLGSLTVTFVTSLVERVDSVLHTFS